jgi:AcrR family transcriptional regulator
MTEQRHIQAQSHILLGGDGDPVRGRHSDAAVLDAVRASVLDVGVRRTTLTAVSQRAGVSRMTLYRRWGGVDRLMRDLLDREFHAAVLDLPPGVATRAELVDAVVSRAAALRADPLFVRVLELDPGLLLPYVTERLGGAQHAAAEVLAGAVRAGQAAGWVRPGDPDRLAYAALLLIQGFVLSARTVADRLDDAALDAELAHALDGYLRP